LPFCAGRREIRAEAEGLLRESLPVAAKTSEKSKTTLNFIRSILVLTLMDQGKIDERSKNNVKASLRSIRLPLQTQPTLVTQLALLEASCLRKEILQKPTPI
jgi:hypothetical protein